MLLLEPFERVVLAAWTGLSTILHATSAPFRGQPIVILRTMPDEDEDDAPSIAAEAV